MYLKLIMNESLCVNRKYQTDITCNLISSVFFMSLKHDVEFFSQ